MPDCLLMSMIINFYFLVEFSGSLLFLNNNKAVGPTETVINWLCC